MKLRCFTLALFFLMCANIGFAQDSYAQQTNSFNEKNPNIFEQNDIWGVGIQAGLLSGMGLGVRYHPAGRFGFQLIGGYITLSDKSPYSVGLEGQFDFDANGLSRFYGYAGLGYYGLNKEDDEATADDESDNDLDGPFRIGIGIAYEWPISKKLILNTNLGFTYFSNGDFIPLPQVGVFYYFN